jgi:hypothetical protein
MPSPPVDDFLYWTGNDQAVPTDFDEESFEVEEEGDVPPNSTDKGKGKRDSMYISVFESQFSHLNVSG